MSFESSLNLPIIDPDQVVRDSGNYHTGLLARDYSAQPFGSLGFSALPVPLIPRNEWDQRIKAMEDSHSTIPELCDYYGLKVKNQSSTNYCFPAGTLIRLADGSQKPIESVVRGDVVRTAEGNAGQVRELSGRYVSEQLVRIVLRSGATVAATQGHPIRVEGQYVPIGEIPVDAAVSAPPDGSAWSDDVSQVVSVSSSLHTGMVYNFSVEGDESYIANGIGVHNCWINAPVHAMEITRLLQGQQHVSLSPASCGAIIKNFRNVGGWGTEGLRFLAEHGAVPSAVWPDNSIDRRYDNATSRNHRQYYKATEWWELRPRSLDELMTCLLLRMPVAVGLNWWGHEVLAVHPVKKNGQYGYVIDNSWGTSWGDNGRGILLGDKAVPDDAVVCRVAVAA